MNPDTPIPLRETEVLQQVRDAARQLLATEWPSDRAPALAEDPAQLRRLWLLAARQGWTALDLNDPELGLGAAIVLQQELGRAACPLPLMDAVLAEAVLAGSSDVRAQALRAQLHAGKLLPAWHFGPVSGEARACWSGNAADGSDVLRLAYVEHGACATHLLLLQGAPLTLHVQALAGARIEPTTGMQRPPLSEVCLPQGTLSAALPTAVALDSLPALARLLLAARALGAAQRGLELLVAYACEREQFGQKIGQYQAIQHKLADCLIRVELCRLAQLHAGQATPGSQDGRYRAAVAVALAGQYLRQTVLETLHGFGGISFWDEHEMPRHFRRIHADVTRLGGVQAARAELAEVLLQPQARMPDFDLGEQAGAFRAEVRAWLAEHWDHQYPAATEGQPLNHRKARQDFSRKLGARGWLGVSWPREYGGQARSALEHLAFEEEMAYSEAPVTWHNTAATMIGPTLIRYGTPAQKSLYLPGIARGDFSFALGYSEPSHGSDLAGMQTRAQRQADGRWCIRGQKIFTSTAGFSTHVWLAARTGPAESRHRGISVFVVPLDTPGISMQPMIGLNDHRSNIVFYDDVMVAADALVGEENGGWEVITAALAFERVSLAAIAARARGYFDQLLAHLQGSGAATDDRPGTTADSLQRDRVGQLAADIEGARLLAVNTALVVQAGQVPVHQAAMVKVFASELMERLAETAFDLLGSGALLRAGPASALIDGRFEYAVRDALLYTIGGGTNEIQRTLIALRGLGLPR